jgi:hypothetical protein
MFAPPLCSTSYRRARQKPISYQSEVSALPWLISADASHRVVAEGFSLDELDAQLQQLGK